MVLAFLGLSLISGAHKSNQQPIGDLYNSKYLHHFRAAISRDRLLLQLKFCRFDDVNTRNERNNDKFCHIQEVWDTFNHHCKELYDLGEHATIDEMLQKFRGRCRFRQYMSSKPGRYGIKYWILADGEIHYCYDAIPYLGKEGDAPAMNLGSQVVKKLVKPIRGSSHNITCDRFFTSVALFEELYRSWYCDAQQKAPSYCITTKTIQRSRSWFYCICFQGQYDDGILVSKKIKVCAILSTLHHNNSISVSGKPEVVEFYKKTKAGVDALGQKVRHYTTYCKTYRWPLAVFYNILDISAYNAFVLYKIRPPLEGMDMSSCVRFKFLCFLGEKLIKPNMQLSAQYPNGLNLVSVNAMKTFNVPIAQKRQQRQDEPPPPPKKISVAWFVHEV